MLNKDRLRSTLLGVQASLFAPPRGPVVTPQALGPREASAIYGELARYGFTTFQLVPGGAQMATGDGVSVLTLTGAGWTYQEDLSRSTFDLAVDKLDVAIANYVEKLPTGTIMLNQVVDLQAQWELEGAEADKLVAQLYLKDSVAGMADRIEGLEYHGAGVRLHLSRPSPESVPPGMSLTGPSGAPQSPIDGFDLRVEPFFADKSKLFLQVVGMFAVTSDMRAAVGRIRYVRELLWEQAASAIALK